MQTVWGYCFIYCKGTPRPKNKIKQYNPHTFFCKLTVPLWIEGREKINYENQKRNLHFNANDSIIFHLRL